MSENHVFNYGTVASSFCSSSLLQNDFAFSCKKALQYIEPGLSRRNATSHFSFHKVFAEVLSSLSSPVPTVLFEEALSWITGTLITAFVKLFEQQSVAEQPAHNLGTENSVKHWVSFYNKCNQTPCTFFDIFWKVSGRWRWMYETIFMNVHTKVKVSLLCRSGVACVVVLTCFVMCGCVYVLVL